MANDGLSVENGELVASSSVENAALSRLLMEASRATIALENIPGWGR